jgi:murein DD-endopeptidase MepM/ murein hydrolase activator NlpD
MMRQLRIQHAKYSVTVTHKRLASLLAPLITILLTTLGVAFPASAQTDVPMKLPTSGTVTQLYNEPSSMYTSGRHSGVDVSGARSINDSNPVFAAAAGKVVYVGHNVGDYGDFVVIYHGLILGKHLYSLYGHMGNRNSNPVESFVVAYPGQDVVAGSKLGRQGNSGLATGIHSHFELRVADVPILENGGALVWSSSHLAQLTIVSPDAYTGLSLTYSDSTHSAGTLRNQSVTATFDTRSSSSAWFPDGTLLNDGSTIWLVENGLRRGFTSASIFTDNGYDFASPIRTTTATCLGAGDFMNGPPPHRFYRQTNSNDIFYITDRNWKRLFATYPSFRGFALDNDAWVYDLAGNGIQRDTFFPDIHTPFQEGTLIKRNGFSSVYVISNGNARLIADEDTFVRLGYRWKDVMVLSDDVFGSVGVDSTHPITKSLIDSCANAGGAADEFGPNLSITSHTDGQTVTTSTVTIAGTASDAGRGESGIASVTVNGIRANGDTASVLNTANWNRSLTLSPGANTITVVATDNAPTPNQTSQTITLTLSGGGGGSGTIATGLSNPTDIATDGNEVFWSDYGSSSIKKVSVNGGTVTTLFSGTYNTSGIALDSTYVYFGYGGELRKIAKSGGSIVVLASNNYAVSHVAVDSASVYWTNYSEGTVKKVSINGGGVTTLAAGPSGPSGITLAGNNVYWTEQNNPGSIKYVSINGGSVNTLANNSNSLGIASDGTNIYWTENVFINSGKVSKIPLLGGATTAIVTGLDRPWDVEVDSANAFWIGGDQNGYVAQVSKNGGSVTTLASSLSSPVAIAADTSNLYWIERNDGGNGTGTLKKIAKGSASGSPGGIPLDFTWQYKQNMPAATWGAATATCNNQIYVLGGSASYVNNYRYITATNSWEQKASMPGGGITEGGAACIGNKIYAIGNWQDTRIRIYDTTNDQWTTGASMSPQVRRGPNVAAVNGKIYVLGSDDFNLNGLNDVHMYDPATDTWTTKSLMPTPRGLASVAVINNLIYVIGGLDESNTPSIKQAVEVYDPASDTWSIKNPAPLPSYIAGFVSLNNRIYILGGGNGSNALNTVSEYDPASDSWRTLSPFHTARYQHVAGTVNGKIYLIGGPDASVEEGTPTGYAPSLSVTPKSQTIYVGSFAPIWLNLSSAQATDTQVTMSSSNSSIASVSNTFFSAGSTTTSNTVWGNSAGGPITIHVKLPDSLGGISDDVSVTVVNRPPDVTTTAAGTVTSTTAILGGSVNPQGTVTNAWFEYGTSSTLSSYYSSSPQLIGSGNSRASVYETLSGLNPNTIYYFRAAASNNAGTSKGAIQSFTTSATPTTTAVNVALPVNGGTTLASSTLAGYSSSRVNDGDRTGASGAIWADGTQSSFPDWIEVDFNGMKTLSEIDLVTLQDNYGNPSEPTLAQTFGLYGATAFDVQYWNGSTWVTVPGGSVTGNNKVWRQFGFAPITTNKVRVTITAGADNNYSRVVELEAWGTPAGANVALAANGGTTASSSALSGYPGSRVNDGDRKGASGAIWADGTQTSFPDWIEVDFNGMKILTEIDLITFQDDYGNPTEPTLAQTFSLYGATAFDMQYWNGSAWVTVSGGSVTGNNKVWRQFSFAPITTNKVRATINAGADNNYSRVVELEAWGTPASSPINIALAANGGTTAASSTLSGYPSSRVNDGERKGASGGIWADGTQSVFPDWIEVDFNGMKTLSEIDLITMQDDYSNPTEPTLAQTFNLYGPTAFDVQYWNGSAWVTVPGGSVTGNNKVWRQFTFSPITTSKVRIMINAEADNNYSRVVELEAWGTPAGINAALPGNGGTTTASSTLAGYPSSRVNDGDRKGASGGTWADGTQSSFPDWIEVDFNSMKTLTEIDLVTLQDNYSNPTEPTLAQTFNLYGATAFDVQYWNGSAWVTVPGGSVTGNNKVWRQFTFAPITTNKVRVTINAGADNNYSRVVELEAWTQPGP